MKRKLHLYQAIGYSRKFLSSTLCFTKSSLAKMVFSWRRNRKVLGISHHCIGKLCSYEGRCCNATFYLHLQLSLPHTPTHHRWAMAGEKHFPVRLLLFVITVQNEYLNKDHTSLLPHRQKLSCCKVHTTKQAKENLSPFIFFILSHLFPKTFFPLHFFPLFYSTCL